jgi:hypothetical protein
MKGRWLLSGLFGLGVSCGGAKQEPVQPPVAREEPAVAALPPLVKVAPPAELFAVARLPNAAKTADTGIAWSGLPMNWRSMLGKAVPGIERAAALDAPVDFAAMLDPASAEEPRVEWAFSIGAASTDAAAAFFRAQGATVTSEAAGAYRARIGKGLTCVVVRALGIAPARVVCSDQAVNADALAPYMSCGMPTESFGNNSELHAHVTAEPFRRRYGSQVTLIRTVGVPFLLRELSLDHPKFDRALRDVLYGLADEVIALAYDLDRLDLDATLAAGGSALDLSTTLAMSGQRSWWSQSAVHAAGSGGPAPDTFWRLPLDSTSAGYSSFGDTERYRGIAASLRELADGWLDYHKLSERRRVPLVEALEQMITTGASTANSTLPDEGSAPPSDKGRGSNAESVRAALGQHLFVLDRGGERLAKLASELVKALGERALREHLGQSKMGPAARLPIGRERAPKFAKGLPPKTKVFELQIPATALTSTGSVGKPGKGNANGKESAPAEKPGEALSVVLVAMPDGPLTWFAFGTDEKMLEERLAEVKAGTGATLAKREGLGALKTETAISAGFSSLAALVGGMRRSLGDKEVPSLKSLTLLPHRGEAPMLFRATVEATGPKLTASGRIPRELVEDLVALAAASAAGMPRK